VKLSRRHSWVGGRYAIPVDPQRVFVSGGPFLTPLSPSLCVYVCAAAGLRPRNLDVKALLTIFELLQQHYPERLNRYRRHVPLHAGSVWSCGVWQLFLSASQFLSQKTKTGHLSSCLRSRTMLAACRICALLPSRLNSTLNTPSQLNCPPAAHCTLQPLFPQRPVHLLGCVATRVSLCARRHSPEDPFCGRQGSQGAAGCTRAGTGALRM
jgi:hypothetical protein